MWPNNIASKLFQISWPIIQAPMAGGISTPELIAAVSNAGGLGSLGAGYMSADEIRSSIKKIKHLTDKPFAVNLFIPEAHDATDDEIEQSRKNVQECCSELNFNIDSVKPPYAPMFDEQMQVILEEEVPVFSFTFGIPSEYWIEIFKRNGIVLVGTATSLEEAKLLEEYGIDAIVAQGSEAGGHRGTFLGEAEDSLHSISTLLPLLVQHVKIPVIAAGGIMDAQGIVASLKQGALGVQMGSAFLCCSESGAHPSYKKLLLEASDDKTTLTRAFSGKLARGVTNNFITRMRGFEDEILDYPIQNKLTGAMRREAARQSKTDFMSLWAGQSAYLCRDCSASGLMQEMVNDVGNILFLM